MMRKEPVDKQGVHRDDDEWKAKRDDESFRDGNPLFEGVRVLDRIIVERKRLRKWSHDLIESGIDYG